MVKITILLKALRYLVTLLALVLSFIGYVVAIRPQIQNTTSQYTLGFLEGAITVFFVTALPSIYAYLVEKEKRTKK